MKKKKNNRTATMFLVKLFLLKFFDLKKKNPTVRMMMAMTKMVRTRKLDRKKITWSKGNQ